MYNYMTTNNSIAVKSIIIIVIFMIVCSTTGMAHLKDGSLIDFPVFLFVVQCFVILD